MLNSRNQVIHSILVGRMEVSAQYLVEVGRQSADWVFCPLSSLSPPVQVTCLSLEHWIPLIADSALIFKILSFYPPRIYSTKARIIRLAPPVVLLLPRLIIVSYSTYVVFKLYSETTVRQGLVLQYMRRSVMRQFVLVATLDFALQAAFCFMASCALLYKTIEFYLNLKQMAAKTIKRKLRFFMVGSIWCRCFQRKFSTDLQVCYSYIPQEATFMTFIPPLALSIACAVLVNGNEDKGNQFRVSTFCYDYRCKHWLPLSLRSLFL